MIDFVAVFSKRIFFISSSCGAAMTTCVIRFLSLLSKKAHVLFLRARRSAAPHDVIRFFCSCYANQLNVLYDFARCRVDVISSISSLLHENIYVLFGAGPRCEYVCMCVLHIKPTLPAS